MEIKPISLWDIYDEEEKNNPIPSVELNGYMLTPESFDKMTQWLHNNTPQLLKEL